MNCLRCGYCCHQLCVMVVDNPKLGIVDGNVTYHDGNGPCKHLKGNAPGEFWCSVHDEPWFEDTPCSRYDQIGVGDCRMGKAILSGQVKAFFIKP